MNCPNGDCENEATRFCDGCDETLCVACHILHNEDLDGEEQAGFVVVSDVDEAIISDRCRDIMGAREEAAQARMDSGNNNIFVYRIGPVGETTDDE